MNTELFDKIMALVGEGKMTDEIFVMFPEQEDEVEVILEAIEDLSEENQPPPSKEAVAAALGGATAPAPAPVAAPEAPASDDDEDSEDEDEEEDDEYEDDEPSFFRSKGFLITVFIILFVVIAFAAYLFFTKEKPEEPAAPAPEVGVDVAFTEEVFDEELALIESLGEDDLGLDETLVALTDLALSDDVFEGKDAASSESGDAELDDIGTELEGELDTLLEDVSDLGDLESELDGISIEDIN